MNLGGSSERFVERSVVDADDRGGEEWIGDEGRTLAKSERFPPSGNDAAEKRGMSCQSSRDKNGSSSLGDSIC